MCVISIIFSCTKLKPDQGCFLLNMSSHFQSLSETTPILISTIRNAVLELKRPIQKLHASPAAEQISPAQFGSVRTY